MRRDAALPTNPGELRRCPDCGGSWPKDPTYQLQGTAWLADLGRHVSQSNFDVLIHDGAHGRDRFLAFELKGSRDWPLSKGQDWMLRALSGQSSWTVAVLRGTTRHTLVHPVLSSGVSIEPIETHAEAIRRAVGRWLAGGLWRDALDSLRKTGPLDSDPGHTCGWARVEGIWTCTQDFYAVGHQPDTSCGLTLPEYP